MNVDGHDTAVTDKAGLEVLTREECLRLLAQAPIGRIVFTDHALPAVQPVNFTMLGTDIVIRTSPESKLAQATRDTVVAAPHNSLLIELYDDIAQAVYESIAHAAFEELGALGADLPVQRVHGDYHLG
ncbi:pyridoxamine 5'-phosphate oxidase family protein, partial [Thermobifida cellulosilytica]|uniref:pyridoxamine 5'-phosphate oxidase family protein n=1 Tax=Thermobifida cellulosilytica TaxID=144786 RepID=UPI000AA3FF53